MDVANIDYEKLAGAMLNQAVSRKAVSSTPTTTYGHGAGGLFSHPALERPVFSAFVMPNLGLQSILPAYPTDVTDPLFGIVTGVTSTTGSEPTGVCDDPPTAGLAKLCMHTFQFGRQSRQTRVFDVDRLGKRRDRADHVDLQLVNNPLRDNPNVPQVGGATGNLLNSEAAKALFELAASWARDFAAEFYTGNPVNNTAGGGRKYYYGLDRLINTGYRDAETGVACPAADSLVASFGNLDVATNGGTLVRTITSMYRRLRFIAANAGLDPVDFAIVMPWSMFYEVSEIWPCAYSTYRCSNTFNTSQVQEVNGGELIRMRDEMRGDQYNYTGQYLLIDGQRVRVVIDDAIAVDGIGAGTQQSSIYFVPLRVLGNRPVTYIEYFDMRTAEAELNKFGAQMNGYYRSSDDGRFLWHFKPPTNFCVQWLAKVEPRLLLLTPFLAARLTNIRYTPLAMERSWNPNSPYFVDGGRTDRLGYGPSYYSPTA